MTNYCCDICGSPDVKLINDTNEVEYRGVSGVIPCRYYSCPECASEYAEHECAKFNKSTMTKFKAEVDNQHDI